MNKTPSFKGGVIFLYFFSSNLDTFQSCTLFINIKEDRMEEYRDIRGFEGKYQVSNLGNIRSVKRDIVLKPLHNIRNGYSQVILWKNSKATIYYIHRLVAQAFIGNIDGCLVRHKDGDYKNNASENLMVQKYKSSNDPE